MSSFKETDSYRAFFVMLSELHVLRNWNLRFKPGNAQENLLMFSEASLTLLTLERFLRILPGIDAKDNETLQNLLEKATSKARNVLELPANDKERAIKEITSVRNTLQHGNYEQAAKNCGLSTVSEYFQKQFASEVEVIYKLLKNLMNQIDPETGKRLSK